jgi:Ca2+-binding EF-hand superfamily protein
MTSTIISSDHSSNIYGLRPDQLYEIQSAFHEFDANHNEYITGDEMRQSLRRFQVRFNDFDIQRILSQIDYNRDGQVSYDEYMTYMSRIYRNEIR